MPPPHSSARTRPPGFRQDESVIQGRGRTFALPGSLDFGSAADITAGEANFEVFNGGLYVDEQLGFREKLYLGGGFRIDAGSSFGDNIDTEFYPKATGSYVLSGDIDLPYLDELKVRAAFGQTGWWTASSDQDVTGGNTAWHNHSARLSFDFR